ncbi:MAG: hypothetical protein ETSY2_44645 [Candidatus Entotheonella gemina]|uniref:RES domain-containing protein n=1 Tax=Candidatus Entotheonella gemina TaxID=1429439 RepID=W4LH65_9BACT|nr:MAG: hypothetical protein ETSY2_44645 [Candidatus Entotheonella gemina]
MTLAAGTPLYRITSPGFLTASRALHANVVNGQGALHNPHGARYNYPGVVTVYLAETLDTCFAEMMFYFQREYLQRLDLSHMAYPGVSALTPPFQKTYVLWRIELQHDVPDIADLNTASAGYFGVFPLMLTNPSQDYWHLKQRRAHIQSQGYAGIRAPSSRSTTGGHIIALFQSQSGNVASIEPVEMEVRLIQPSGAVFSNHVTESLDFEACEVQATSNPLPSWVSAYSNWNPLRLHH